MLSLTNVKPNTGSRKTFKRLGRGNGSGKWTYCGRGCNGQNCRSGGWVAAWFEWGQTPLFRRMPKLKGFSNAKFMKEYNIINLSDLEILAQKGITTINKEVLLENRIIRDKNMGVKLLGNWVLTTKVEVSVNKLSKTAAKALDKLGAKVEITE